MKPRSGFIYLEDFYANLAAAMLSLDFSCFTCRAILLLGGIFVKVRSIASHSQWMAHIWLLWGEMVI